MTLISILLLIFIIIFIFVLNLAIFILVTVFERKNRIKKIKKNLGYFSVIKISQRLDSYSSLRKVNTDISNLNTKASELKNRDIILINKKLDQLSKLATINNFYKFNKFRKQNNEVINLVDLYEENYLHLSFTLFDLTSDLEVEKATLQTLRDKFSRVKEVLSNSPNEKIRENKKLNNELSSILDHLKQLEIMIKEESISLSSEFINLVEVIDKGLNWIEENLNLINFYDKHVKEDLNYNIKNILHLHKDNAPILRGIEDRISSLSEKIRGLKLSIEHDIEHLRITRAGENVDSLDILVRELNLLVRSNIDYHEFNVKFNDLAKDLLNYANKNHQIFISEIRRHEIKDEQTILKDIESKFIDFKKSVNKFESEKLANKMIAPDYLSELLFNLVKLFIRYIKILNKNVTEISKINDATDDMNKIIAKMNTGLLQSEHNINSIEGIVKENYDRRKEELDSEVSVMRDSFRSNTKKIGEIKFKEAEELRMKIDNLVSETRGTAFENFLLKETILYLNKFRGKSLEIDSLLDSIQKSYRDERYVDALRKSKELVEMYGIK